MSYSKEATEKLWEHRWGDGLSLEELKSLLEQKADPNVRNMYDYTTFHSLVCSDKIEHVKLLLEYKANPYSNYNYFPTDRAIDNNSTDMVLLLLEHKGNTDVTDTRTGNSMLMRACMNNNSEIVKSLVKHGAKIDDSNSELYTPLIYACACNQFEIAKILLEGKADVNKKTIKERTALGYACENNNFELVQLLLEYKADLETKEPLLNYSCKNTEITKILLQNGLSYKNPDYKAVLQALYENNTEKALLYLEKLNLNLQEHGLLFDISIEKENNRVIEYFKNKIN